MRALKVIPRGFPWLPEGLDERPRSYLPWLPVASRGFPSVEMSALKVISRGFPWLPDGQDERSQSYPPWLPVASRGLG